MKLEKKLLEELARHKAINRYVSEQAAPPTVDAPAAEGTPPPPTGDAGGPPPADASATPPLHDNAAPAPEGGGTPPPPAADAPAPPPMADEAAPAGSEENVGMSDLVNMTKELQSKVEQEAGKNADAVHKMDAIFSKLDELGNQLAQMDAVIQKINDLEQKVDESKPLTPEEKLNLRSYDSYPFNQKLSDFFRDKEPEMKATRKNEYVLTQDDAANFMNDDMAKSFDAAGLNEGTKKSKKKG